MNLYEKIEEEIGTYDGPAVIDRGRTVGYQELLRDVKELSEKIKLQEIARDSRVAILGNDSYEYIALSLAVLRLNAAIVPFSSRARTEEIHGMLTELGVNTIIRAEAFREAGDEKLEAPGILQDSYYWKDLCRDLKPIDLGPGRIAAFIRFSSGTTGRNKGVVLSHDSVIERTDACTELGVKRGEKVFWVLDMAFHFVVTILLFLRKGACIVICPPPVEANMAQVLKTERVNLLYATPYHYRVMSNSPEIERTDLSEVRRAFSTAMKLEPLDARAFLEKFGHPLTQAYGIIEVGLPCVNCSDREDKASSVGKLQKSYSLELVDPDESGAGRILLRGPGFFDAYLTPFRTRAEACPNGGFDTGDIGCLDADGYLYIVGRAKNLINFAGMKIFPYEVEEVLHGHPLVKECRVSGRAAGSFGEVPEAEIVFHEGVSVPEDWRDELRAFCYGKLSSYKVPKYFKEVASLPRTASGKILRK